MAVLIVANNPADWPFDLPGVELVSARKYLAENRYSRLRGARVFNLCRSYRYQSTGYYVSLLASARGHRAFPSIMAMQDMKSPSITRFISEDIDEIIQQSLKTIQSGEFTLSIYFGRNMAKKHDRLSRNLFKLFQAPLLQAHFRKNDLWRLHSIRPVAASEIPETHRDFVVEFAREYFSGKRIAVSKRAAPRFDLAILRNPMEHEPPSDEKALKRFVKAAVTLGMRPELIEREDYGRIAEFDALFIRETTAVNHHTYRFARRAAAEGLVVIDDPDSILKCTNKVYLAELLNQHGIPAPKTLIVHRENVSGIADVLKLPCILKKPDSSFSQGVIKVEDKNSMKRAAMEMLEKSDLVIAQEYLPTPFDWRVGILDGKPLYVCKYYMARKHWQIIKRTKMGKTSEGKVETFPVERAPRNMVRTAVKAANIIGKGLYGVDLKQVGRKYYVIEINDNPSIDAGFEDAVLKDGLYRKIMEVILKRIEKQKRGGGMP